MPQHDMNIGNQLFPPTRSDLNDALLALVGQNSGATPPATTFAFMWWADTSTNILKLRNSANTAWIEVLDLTDGTVVQPTTIEPQTIGAIAAWAGDTAPNRWAFCYGQVLSRTDYPGLFNAIGTRFNTGGETSSQFRLPDLRGRAIFGKDNMGGTAASRVTSALSGVDGATLGAVGGDQRLATHSHTASTSPAGAHNHGQAAGINVVLFNSGVGVIGSAAALATDYFTFAGFATDTEPDHTHPVTVNNAGAGGSANMPPAMVLNWIIYTGAIGSENEEPGPLLGDLEAIRMDCLGETTTVAVAEVYRFRMPYKFAPQQVRASLRTGTTTGIITIGITVNGTPLFSTNLTIDATEKTSVTAATPAVLALASLADDAEVIVSVSGAGDGTATGLKVVMRGYRELT